MTTFASPVGLLKAIWHDDESVVYFVLNPDNGLVKIGRTKSLGTRLATFRTSIPGVVLLGHFPGGATAEADLHASFAADRVAGEWFRMTPALARTILDLKSEAS